MAQRLLVIVGPTATGKTEAGALLAEALGGEIVSADSMQVYRGMDIGTAKPTADQQSRVPHHVVDVRNPDQPFSVAEYRDLADTALSDTWSRGRQPILVGGSGLYVRAVLEEMDFGNAPPDPALRRTLAEEAKRVGTRALHRRLAEADPKAAAGIHPNDEKRIIRALEVSRAAKRPGAGRQQLDRDRRERYNTRRFGLALPREELYRRVEARVDAMIERGLVAEVAGLVERGYGEHLVAMKGLGYAQIAPHVRGQASLKDAVARLKRDTRRFAKRQLTWFRADPEIEWVDVMAVGDPVGVAAFVRRRWEEQ